MRTRIVFLRANTPASLQALLAPCSGGGFCTPDTVIASADNFVPPSCVSIAGAEGRCVSTCLPWVAARAALLPKVGCAAGTVCAPCFDPLATDPTTPTGACSLGCDVPSQPPTTLTCPWSGPPVLDPTTLPTCGCNGAHCLPAAGVPVGVQSMLNTCAGGFCTPDTIIKSGGNGAAISCAPYAGVTTAAGGRCVSSCLPVVAQNPTLETSSCATGTKCAPCADPFTGADTGACSLTACDAPPAQPYKFPNCCVVSAVAKGRCLPLSQIPASSQSNFAAQECAGLDSDYLCVPNEMLPAPNATPGQACSGTSLAHPTGYTGTCMSACLNFPADIGLEYSQGNCPANYRCIGCADAPAGSPGCP